MAVTAEANARSLTPCPRAQDMDRHIGARMRGRRMMLGLTQQQLAELIGVTYQQAHKYETGMNRISGGRLYAIAQALGVEVGFLYEGIGAPPGAGKPTEHQRLLLELARNFVAITNRRQQEAICSLARSLASTDMEAIETIDVTMEDKLAQVA